MAPLWSDAEWDVHDETSGDGDEQKRHGGKLDDHDDRVKGDPDELFGERQRNGLAIVAVFKDATVVVASSSFSPHVAVMQPADAGQRHHLRVS